MKTEIIPYKDQTGTWINRQREELKKLYTNVSSCDITKVFHCTNNESDFK